MRRSIKGRSKWCRQQGFLRRSAAAGRRRAPPGGWIGEIAFVPQSNLIVTGSDDYTIRIWNAKTGRQIHKLEHEYWVRGLAVSPDGKWLASSSLDDTVRLWELSTGREIYKLFGHGDLGGKRVLRFTPDSKRFISWGDDGYLRVWDVETGKALAEHMTFAGKNGPNENLVWPNLKDRYSSAMELKMLGAAVISPKGKTFAACTLADLHVFSIQTGKKVAEIPKFGRAWHMAYSSSGEFLLANGYRKETVVDDQTGKEKTIAKSVFHIWDLTTRKIVQTIPVPTDHYPGEVAFSSDNKKVAVAIRGPQTRIWIWQVGGKRLRTIDGFPGQVTSLAFSPDDSILASGLSDTTVVLWELKQQPH